MLDLKEATSSLIESYHSKEVMKTLERYYEKTTEDLIQKFNLLIDDIKEFHPGVWGKISDTHSKLKEEIGRLCSYFNYNSNSFMEDLKEILDQILKFMRIELRKLWKISVKDIIEEARLGVES